MGLMRRLRRSFRAPRKVPGAVRAPAESGPTGAPSVGVGNGQVRACGCGASRHEELQELLRLGRETRAELAAVHTALDTLETRLNRVLGPPRLVQRLNSLPERTHSLVASVVSLEEGPGCVLKEDEFYDALAASLLQLDAEDERKDQLRKRRGEERRDDDEQVQREGKTAEEAGKEGEQQLLQNEQGLGEEGRTEDEQKQRQGQKSGEERTETEGKAEGDQEASSERDVSDLKMGGDDKISDVHGQETPHTILTSSGAPPKPDRLCESPADPASTGGSSPAPAAPLPPAAGSCTGGCAQLGHPLAAEIGRVVSEQLAMVSADPSEGWTLFAQEGAMKMYRLELAEDNRSVDPLKAVHEVRGVTARELCRHYWEPDVRLDWETTVDRVTVLARPDPSTVLCQQVHRRIWPAQQRFTVFWSHLCRRTVAGRAWSVVVNHSLEGSRHEPPEPSGCVRARMTTCLAGRDEEGGAPGRDRLRCHVAYSSHVDPGGWAPTGALRLVCKREYPRFLQRFTGYVGLKCRDQPVEL